MCPGHCHSRDYFDHTNLWVPADPGDRPFLLSHPYHFDEEAVAAYASAHGLSLELDEPGDNWYGAGTTPVRLTVGSETPVLWPIEAEAAVLLDAFPIPWPKE